jgi:uncharacterized protein (DUF488 family)
MIFTIGFTKKSLEQFIKILQKNKIERVVDIRLKNNSQLAGFAKGKDLEYILRLVGIEYVYVPLLAPSEEIFSSYKKDSDWEEYEKGFRKLMMERDGRKILEEAIEGKRCCLLCSEETADRCHRRLVGEMIGEVVNL